PWFGFINWNGNGERERGMYPFLEKMDFFLLLIFDPEPEDVHGIRFDPIHGDSMFYRSVTYLLIHYRKSLGFFLYAGKLLNRDFTRPGANNRLSKGWFTFGHATFALLFFFGHILKIKIGC
ncbi:hypothetical protein ACJX0J_008290, partial [Zea mays]